MRYADRMLIGLLLVLVSLAILWWGSPDRTGSLDAAPAVTYLFLGFFAVGFIVFSMGILGSADDYPALLSGFVLYFIVGGLVAVLTYVTGHDVGGWTLEEARYAGFWAHWMRVAAMWPLQLVQQAGILGYRAIGF